MKYLSNSSEKEYNLIARRLLLLQENPFRKDLDTKKLEGQTNVFRLRIGKVRILFSIQKDKLIVFVFDAGSRGDIYK